MSEIRYDDRVAIITGAGGGLGKTYALMLAARGASVVVNDLGGAADGTGAGTSMADEVVKEITEAGGKAVANYDSVSTPEGGEAICKAAVDSFGKVDILINNAGILRDKTFAKLEPQHLEAVIDVHLKGAFFVTQPVFRVMKENNYGRILFASSGAGIFGNFGQTNYGAAKMGLVGLCNVLSVEGAKYNIKCNAIAAGRGAGPGVRHAARDLPVLRGVRAQPRDLRRGRRTLRAYLRRHGARLGGTRPPGSERGGHPRQHRPDPQDRGLHHPFEHRRRNQGDRGGAEGLGGRLKSRSPRSETKSSEVPEPERER
jgi:NAD(P)-dependent dehydrogenase (short-subunit alcohol dehydrogenase family)